MDKKKKKKLTSKERFGDLKFVWQKMCWLFKNLRKPFKKILSLLDFIEFDRKERAQFFLNIGAGLLIILIMHGLESTQWGEGALNNAFDLFIRIDAKRAVKTNADMGDIFLVDIGHDINEGKNTSKSQNNSQKISYLSPRDTIANILQMAFDGGAKIIVPDIFFEEHDCCDPKKDDALRTVLSKNKTQTKVVFPVNIQNKAPKALIFDHEIDQNPNYFRAIPVFYASQSDCIGRYWKVFQEYGNNKICWSIPVLTLAFHTCKMEELKKLENMIGQGKGTCVYALEMKGGKNKKFLLPIGYDDIYLQRIRYLLIPKDCITTHPEGNIRLPTIENLTPERFKDKIVIIGNSDPNVEDSYFTPVGNMPGMFIHGNSLYTLLQGLQPRRASLWVSLLINIFIIILAAFLFHYLHSFLADLLGMIGSIVILGSIAYFYFFREFGIFPNFVFGIAGIGYIETMYSLRELFSTKNGKTKDKEVSG
jgi:CHASE2 domain-containing sensor protein